MPPQVLQLRVDLVVSDEVMALTSRRRPFHHPSPPPLGRGLQLLLLLVTKMDQTRNTHHARLTPTCVGEYWSFYFLIISEWRTRSIRRVP